MSIEDGARAETLTKQEKALRQRFVKLYVECFDEFEACIRLGYAEAYARQWAQKFMLEPYTLELIAKEKAQFADSEVEAHRKRVLGVLYKESHNRFAPATARVSAALGIARITGAEAPVKVQTQQVLPQVGDIDLTQLTDAELEVLEKVLGKKFNEAAPAD